MFTFPVGFMKTSEFSPLDISGLEYWVRADNGIVDISGNSRVITNAGVGVTITSAALNGHDVFEFDGASALTTPDVIGGTGDKTMYVVYKSTTTTTGSIIEIPLGQGIYTGGETSFQFQERDFTAGIIGSPSLVAGDTRAATGDALDNVWKYVSGSYDGAQIQLRENGSVKATTAVSTVDTNADIMSIGSSSGLGAFLNGQVEQVLVWNRLLTNDEFTEIDSYISDRTGL